MRFILAAITLAAFAAPAQGAWHEATSAHFRIYADLPPAELRAFAERLERFDKAVRVVRGMGDPILTPSNRLRVYALRDEGAVARLSGGGSGVRGFYAARASGAVAFVPRKAGSKSDKWDLDTEEIFFHEYSHHLQHQYSSLALPAWFIEGFAEFFATAEIKPDGSVAIGNPPLYRAWGLTNPSSLTMAQMVGGTYRRLTPLQAEHLYARGWLLTHYLTFEKSRRGQLDRYVQGIQNGMSALDSARAAFGDLRQLNGDLTRHLRKPLVGIEVSVKALPVAPVAVRELKAAEAAVIDVHIRSTRGVNDKSARGVAADARKAAAPYPHDPFVQTVLAEAEYDARNFAAADAAVDRALAADPSNVQALIYKGRAQMELAKSQPKVADWAGIRAWFTRANKLDTENAEPLMLFYQSYVETGQTPTRNAVAALLYAAELAPQDLELRITAVRQLLIEGRVPEARRFFAPVAFRPHASGEARDTSDKIMDAIVTNDAKAALTLIDAAMDIAKKEAKKP